nr:light-harvesting complex-like protein 3 isotype 1, chloroplastic isoform X1 [Tanacetum cinerariifolium]
MKIPLVFIQCGVFIIEHLEFVFKNRPSICPIIESVAFRDLGDIIDQGVIDLSGELADKVRLALSVKYAALLKQSEPSACVCFDAMSVTSDPSRMGCYRIRDRLQQCGFLWSEVTLQSKTGCGIPGWIKSFQPAVAASKMILRRLTLSERTLQKAASLYGFELCQEKHDNKKLGLKNVAIIVANVSTFEMEGSYDKILSIEMFEHPDAKLLNGAGRAVDVLTGLDVVGQSGNFICKIGLFATVLGVILF